MREQRKDKFRLEHILEAIDRLETHAGSLSREELESDVLRYYGIVKNIEIITIRGTGTLIHAKELYQLTCPS